VFPKNRKLLKVDGQAEEWVEGWNMMPSQACAFVRAAHGHAKALRTWPQK